MSAAHSSVKLADVLEPVARAVTPEAGTVYRQLGVRLWGEGAYAREPIDGSQTKYSSLYRVETDDIVVNKIWARNGSVAVVPTELAGAYVSSEFPTFAVDDLRLDPRWFHWITKTRSFWSACDAQSQGTSGKNRIRPERFLAIEIPLPPLDEMRRIVARLDGHAALIASLRSEHNALLGAMDALDGSAASRLIDGAGGETMPVEAVLAGVGMQNGRSLKSWGAESNVLCLSLNAIRRGQLDSSQGKPVPLTRDEASNYLVSRGDVFVVRGNGSRKLVGQAGRMRDDAVGLIFPDLFIRLTLDSTRIDPDYFVLAWNAPGNRSVIEDTARTTSGIWKISQRDIARTVLAVPPLPAQRDLVRRLERISRRTLEGWELAKSLSAQLDALMPAILRRALVDDHDVPSAGSDS